ncbi:hypothetical protein P8452_56537 [Trifolium repens]|nr:hypothetical protein P8452_56537 [Trifolium repens]
MSSSLFGPPLLELKPLSCMGGGSRFFSSKTPLVVYALLSNATAPSFLGHSCNHISIQGSINQCKAKRMMKEMNIAH